MYITGSALAILGTNNVVMSVCPSINALNKLANRFIISTFINQRAIATV